MKHAIKIAKPYRKGQYYDCSYVNPITGGIETKYGYLSAGDAFICVYALLLGMLNVRKKAINIVHLKIGSTVMDEHYQPCKVVDRATWRLNFKGEKIFGLKCESIHKGYPMQFILSEAFVIDGAKIVEIEIQVVNKDHNHRGSKPKTIWKQAANLPGKNWD